MAFCLYRVYNVMIDNISTILEPVL